MQNIEIDFEVFKALTSRRRSESHTYNEVIRELLDIDRGSVVHGDSPLVETARAVASSLSVANGPTKGLALRGLLLPNGTLLRATHKGQTFEARITDGQWINSDGTAANSPSAAATAVTNTNVSGWRFWKARRPSDSDWHLLDALPKAEK